MSKGCILEQNLFLQKWMVEDLEGEKVKEVSSAQVCREFKVIWSLEVISVGEEAEV